jgi:hypothetical protein
VETPWILQPGWPTSSYNDSNLGAIPVPETIQFRFKNIDLKNNPPASQSLWVIENSAKGDCISLVLTYTGSSYASASYSGSIIDPYYQYAKLDFIPSADYPNESASIHLPFYDNSWWSVMITWNDNNNFTLYAGNKLQYDGYDGNQIGFLVSASVISTGNNWKDEEADGSYFGKRNNQYLPEFYEYFTGSFQEIRYYSRPLGLDSFKDFIMNPNSVDTVGENTYADYLAFRGTLGGELYTGSISVHPKITGSWSTTQSFNTDSSDFTIQGGGGSFSSNIENVFLNSPIAGLRNRVTDKIQIIDQELPPINLYYTQSGNTLSQYISIEQNYLVSGSETPDVNALEIAFSPTNEVDDDIIASLGYFNIGDYIGDPRQISSSATSYPDLNILSSNYFQKYYDRYDLYDYIRLIKFFDNSLFKMIKDFVPARTNLRSGIVVKQHILERNKYPQPQTSWEDVTYSGSIDTAFFTGSTGGTFNEFNVLTDTQSYPFVVSSSTNFFISGSTYINYFNTSSSIVNITTYYPNEQIGWNNGELITYFNGELKLFVSGTNTPGGNLINVRFSSSIQGNIGTQTIAASFLYTSSVISCIYGEKFSVWVNDNPLEPGINTSSMQFGIHTLHPYSQQTWPEFELGPSGSSYYIRDDQREFYNGELPGTEIEVTNGELNEANVFKYPSTLEINYDIVFYKSNIINLDSFLNTNTSPNQGEIYLYYDTGSFLSYQDAGLTPVIRLR